MIGAVEVGSPMRRGPLALFPILGVDVPAGEYVTGPAAATAAVLDITEADAGPSVPELVIGNRSARPVLLLEGETVVGVKQNRTLNVTVLLPAGSRTTVPVSCVEAGRWGSAQTAERSPHHAPARLRAAKVASVTAAVRSGAAPRSDQGRVWQEVDAYVARHGMAPAAAPTHALEDVQRARSVDIAALVGGTAPLAGQRGVIAAAGGDVLALDLFDRRSTLADYWPALVAGYLLDALTVTTTRPHPSPEVLAALVGRLSTAGWTRVAGRGLGDEIHLADPDVVGTGLEWDGRPVHVAAFPATGSRSETEPSVTHAIRRSRRWFGSDPT